jgi:hypothetical protein
MTTCGSWSGGVPCSPPHTHPIGGGMQPDVELAPSLDEISNLETALKHRYAEAATEWLSESTTFMEIVWASF